MLLLGVLLSVKCVCVEVPKYTEAFAQKECDTFELRHRIGKNFCAFLMQSRSMKMMHEEDQAEEEEEKEEEEEAEAAGVRESSVLQRRVQNKRRLPCPGVWTLISKLGYDSAQASRARAREAKARERKGFEPGESESWCGTDGGTDDTNHTNHTRRRKERSVETGVVKRKHTHTIEESRLGE